MLERPAAHARLEIYDQLGRQLTTLLDSPLGPGPYEVSFDAAGLAAGIYLYRLSVDGRAAAKRMVVVR
ncbi:MAG TPA: T9SS type A sorting domain-containing protein [Rhodothermales bacterium]|nr:T9SS type A sorting domain-containing protein [Rhodothermales bacterium]